jgi:hypothetical protein
MYEPLDSDEEGKSYAANANPTNQDRDIFINSMLGEYLGPEKLKEKEQIADKIKFKRHQLELVKQKLQTKTKAKKKGMLSKKKFNEPLKIDKNLTKKFEDFKVMNQLWQKYILNVLG